MFSFIIRFLSDFKGTETLLASMGIKKNGWLNTGGLSPAGRMVWWGLRPGCCRAASKGARFGPCHPSGQHCRSVLTPLTPCSAPLGASTRGDARCSVPVLSLRCRAASPQGPSPALGHGCPGAAAQAALRWPRSGTVPGKLPCQTLRLCF